MATKITPADKVSQRLVEIRERGMQYRDATVVGVNIEARTVELSFSSEVEYRRWYGVEILSHEDGHCDLTRLNNKAPALWMHDWDDMRGVIEPGTARIDSDRVGRCTIRLSKNSTGEALLQDIADGIVTKVSVGYMVHGIKLTEERDDVDVFTVNAWEPYEVSLVSVPADDSVGVGRSAKTPQEESRGKSPKNPANINDPEPTSARTKTTMEKFLRNPATGDFVRAKVDAEGKIVEVLEIIERAGADTQAALTRGAAAEQARVAEIRSLAKQYGAEDKAGAFIDDPKKTAADFQRELLHAFAEQRGRKPMAEQEAAAGIGMTQQEVRSFSLLRAIRAIMPDASKADKDAAAFELEASRAAAEKYGKQPKGIIIPGDVLADRAFGITNGNTGNGGAVVATQLLSGSFIDILRKRAWVMRRARTLAGLVGNVDIPKQTGTTQAYWVGEGGSPNASTPALDQIGFTPKTVGAYTDITRRLLKQATPDAEAIVRDDLMKVLGLEIDRVAIYGSGSEYQPKGVKNYSGINGKDFAAAGQPTFAELVDMETQIALDNADVDSMSYAFNAAIRGHCKTTPKFGTGTESTIWESGGTVNGYATDVSNQIETGDVFFGNWADLVIALWGGLELTVDPYALSTSGGIRLIALQDIDVNLRRLESFCWGSNLVS